MLSEFESCMLLTLLIAIMLYTNYKYPRHYIFQSFWIIMISIVSVSIINLNTFYVLTLMLFNILINIFYLSFKLKDV